MLHTEPFDWWVPGSEGIGEEEMSIVEIMNLQWNEVITRVAGSIPGDVRNFLSKSYTWVCDTPKIPL